MKELIQAPAKKYAEIYQDSDLKFSFALEDETSIRQVHDWIKCRDFFNEALVASQVGCESPRIFGFEYPAKEFPADLDTTRLLLKGTNFETLKKNLPMFNEYEKFIGIEPTEIAPIENYYYLTADDTWMRSTVMISLYTHILRCLYQYEHEGAGFLDWLARCSEQHGNAAKYQTTINEINVNALIREVDRIFPRGTVPFEGMSEIENVATVHNRGGIVSWSTSIVKNEKDVWGMYSRPLEVYRSIVA